jgi:hypothetical protein
VGLIGILLRVDPTATVAGTVEGDSMLAFAMSAQLLEVFPFE